MNTRTKPLRIGVLADDLSGSLASAAALRSQGLETVVCWDRTRGENLIAEADAVVVDMATRDSGDPPERTAREWTQWLVEHGVERVELRIDTTLRGSPDEELAGVLAVPPFTGACVLAVPAYPRAGRTAVRGQQRILDADGSVTEIDLDQRLFNGSGTLIPLHDVRGGHTRIQTLIAQAAAEGATRFITDSEHEGDIRSVGRAAALLESDGVKLVTLSPGAWLRYRTLRPQSSPTVIPVVIGSATRVNREALDFFRQDGRVLVLDAYGDDDVDIDAILASTEVVVVETLTSGADDRGGGSGPSRRAATFATNLIERLSDRGARIGGVVASGGETARHLIDGLRAEAVRSRGEAAPLCAHGELAGGPWDGLPIITKGGRIGNPTTLYELSHLLQQGATEDTF